MANGYRPGFDVCVAFGEAAEDAFRRVLRGEAKVEIKRDAKCADTGNLFIEYRQRGGRSGLATTQAEYWAFMYRDDHWLVVPTEALREVAARIYQEHPERRCIGGDNENHGILVPIKDLLYLR